jgi:aconitate hydratase
MIPGNNSFNTLSTLDIDGREYFYYSLDKLAEQDLEAIRRLPFSLKILLENILRCERGGADTAGDIRAFADWLETRSSQREIAFRPARVLMQDFTGVPAVVDLAAMRDAAGDHPARINPGFRSTWSSIIRLWSTSLRARRHLTPMSHSK